MKNITKIPTFVGIAFLSLSIIVGIYLLGGRQILRIGATPEAVPQNLQVSNITDSSFTVTWITDGETVGFIKYGASQDATDAVANDEISQPSRTHYATVKDLTPNSAYYFKVNSGGTDYDADGAPWTVNTASDIGVPSTKITISGSVKSEIGDPVPHAIVQAQIPNASVLSTTTSLEGNWFITLSFARDLPALNSYAIINPSQTLTDIYVRTATSEGSAKIYPASANPSPAIVLGQANDFTDISKQTGSNTPSANLTLPTGNEIIESKLVVEENSTPSAETASVTLDSHQDGETITTVDPEFFGTGPVGTTISITVESDPQTEDITIPGSGDWKWSPPDNLPPGPHKVTLSWRDVKGILHEITRNFTVQAAESNVPSFESTPSASTTPSPTATATPSATATATPVPIPVTGELTPTLMLTIMGLGVILLSALIALVAF